MRNLKNDFARVLSGWEFAAAVAATVVLCFSVQVYVDYSTSKAYSVFEALFLIKPAVRAQLPDFLPPMIIRMALTGYSAMALPVTASFPFVISFIAERTSGNMILTLSRTSRGKYYVSKFVSAILGGGLCTALGVIIFGIFAFILFQNSCTLEQIEWAFPNGVLAGLAKKLLSAFIYGMTSVLPAFFICAFCKNPYIALCFPFMLKFILEAVLVKIQTNAWASKNYAVSDFIAPLFPDAASRLVYAEVGKSFWITLIVTVIFAGICFAGFAIIMEKRTDRGH
ncbi:MAG: hypothetical protein K2J77_06255 [Oscillospiraceae bacterium]|nr:hypothetical protein [Oscillospiraceae bacterium]